MVEPDCCPDGLLVPEPVEVADGLLPPADVFIAAPISDKILEIEFVLLVPAALLPEAVPVLLEVEPVLFVFPPVLPPFAGG